ncbi:TPA: restriction endonuclease subunit S [Yersinia enterocolitica]|uniref:restriction endonuclease subunit S n=1 Tax=Yersinia enterocolitica TaxID=630 RepID=UPI0028622E2D|nr:restriction endonuclease subunit S [Yersinia enterocolitica]ELI8383109.1 restriction endonuclease subunit S [Yersinia enterocolitica]HDL8537633.1 restriction endonuclease subunit S [Yersinia enterocolitica]HDV7526379.1 restriction endonuclease subunit S [Yersinia enterocolitica]HEI6858350.1 restriction endonuclease subunit S [Yersinia enterocolitica]
MSMDSKVPEIRFKGFSGEWAEETLGAVAEIKTGPFGSTLHAKAYVEDGHAIITTEHFKSGELPVDKKGIPQVSDDDYLRLKAYLLKVGDIVFSRVGSVDINAHVKNKQKGWLFSGRVLRVRSGKIIDSEYLHHELSTSRVKKSVVSRAVGQTMPSINTEILKITPIHFPLYTTEQTAIGNYFQKLDSLINQHQQKHDKLSNIKKAMLEKMFPKPGETVPEIRFKGFSGEWVENNLGELIDIRSAARVHKEQWTEAGVPFFRTSDVVSIYKGQENTKAYISHEIYHGLSEKIGKVTKDDLLITGGGSIGIPYLVPNDSPLYFKDADLLWLKNNEKFNGYFLYTFFFSVSFKQHIKSISHTGTIAHYTIEQAKATPINTCSDEEQTAIGNYFQKLDALINQHQQQIAKLNNIKQACLSKMFI